MNEFSTYSPEDIILANLREVSLRGDMIWEQQAAHLRELADELARDGAGDLFHSLSEHDSYGLCNPVPPDFSPAFFEKRSSMQKTLQQVFLCRTLVKKSFEKEPLVPENFFPEVESIVPDAMGRIAYQRNSYADSAYLRFAEQIPSPRARYAHSFSGVCEDVYNGLCEFGLLPLESSSEGPLTGFSRLIDRYELKIVATCDIPATDGLRYTKFALLRRDLIPPSEHKERYSRYFEFSTSMSKSPDAAEILNAAALCSLSLCRLDCRAVSDTDEERRMHYVIGIDGGDLIAFLLYLSMAAPHYRPTGIYYHIKDKGDS